MNNSGSEITPFAGSVQRAWYRLSLAGWLALFIHLVAMLGMALILRHGLETNPDLLLRLQFIAGNAPLWIGAWLTWNAAAFTILYFYACFAWAHETEGAAKVPLRFAVLICTAAVALDLAAETIELGVLPDLARDALSDPAVPDGTASVQLFLTVHRTAVLLTGFSANGLYTLSAALLIWSTREVYPRWILLAGLGVVVLGLSLSGACLANSVSGMFWTNALLAPCLLAWLMGVALTARRRSN